MKNEKKSEPKAELREDKSRAKAGEKVQSPDLGLKERRSLVRPLPVPDVVESDADSAWSTFQALISDTPE